MKTNRVLALLKLFDETAVLFHRLRVVAAEVHGQRESSAGRRGILQSLGRLGPQTVPQLARARPVSRQHVQMLVNELLKEGLVATEENPAHRRSSLLCLTAKGNRQLQAMKRRERRLLAHIPFALPTQEIDQAACTLQSVRQLLESKEWKKYVARYDREVPQRLPE